jgi:ABC-type transport system involved in multi-copper enzyme maturation permease subunit
VTSFSVADVTRNPVLRRELSERAASKRAAVAVTLWLLLLSGLACLVYWAYTSTGDLDPVSNDAARVGRDLMEWTLFGMMGLVLFLVPAFTASSVAGERTRQTLIPVQVTALSPFAIVLGKALAAVAFTVLLVIIAAPILSVAFLIGGVGVTDILKGVAMIVLTAVMLGSAGIMFSAMFKKVQGAIVVTYGFVLALAVGTFILLAVVAVANEIRADPFRGSEPPPKELLAPNPFVALADFTSTSDRRFGSNPLTGLRVLVTELNDDNPRALAEPPDGEGGPELEATSVWRWYVVFSALMIYTSLHASTNLLRTPARTER